MNLFSHIKKIMKPAHKIFLVFLIFLLNVCSQLSARSYKESASCFLHENNKDHIHACIAGSEKQGNGSSTALFENEEDDEFNSLKKFRISNYVTSILFTQTGQCLFSLSKKISVFSTHFSTASLRRHLLFQVFRI